MVQALISELDLQKDYLLQEKINTVYFGGGTPSLLSGEELHRIFDQIKSIHAVDNGTEITLEANPDDLTLERLKEFKSLGINRLSLGIQTFNDALLQYLNRAHDAKTARSGFYRARDAGFTNVSIDLIYAIPGQYQDSWEADIEEALALAPEHISTYSLTIEEKTVFGHWAKTGRLKPADEEIQARYLELLMTKLEGCGYEQYEVSNFALPGYYSRHNSSYWKGEKYLGIGPSAHSYNQVSRQFNIRNNHLYMKSIEAGVVPAEIEVLSVADQINEFLLTTLRTSWGCDFRKLHEQYQYDLMASNQGYIESLIRNELAIRNDHILYLTRKGKLLADRIASDLFVTTL